jgi:hypothetical protein
VAAIVAPLGFALTWLTLAAFASVLLDDVYQAASSRVEETWSVRAAPLVIVDTFHGGIWVYPGEPGVVKATVEPHSSWKNGSLTQACTFRDSL